MKKITIVYGTRPEFIKLYPLIKYLKKIEYIKLQVISTGQHTDLLNSIHAEESFSPDINLNINRVSGDLNELQSLIFEKLLQLSKVDERPELIIVHGDTASAFSTALFAFQFQIPIAHIEAGLRSSNLKSPFPEEFYRQSISKMATLNFAPTELEKSNLILEGIEPKNLFVVGNTISDAVNSKKISNFKKESRVLVTVHRRENQTRLLKLLKSLNEVSENLESIRFDYLLHPAVKDMIIKEHFKNINFLEPMEHRLFLEYLTNSMLVITDSGGVQEEANILGVQTLLFRKKTERSDGLDCNIKLVGTNINILKSETILRLNTAAKSSIQKCEIRESVSEKIADIINNFLAIKKEEELCLS